MASPVLRPASAADVSELVTLINAAYRTEALVLYRKPRINPGRVQQLLASGELLVLEEAGELVGSVHLARNGDDTEISLVAVRPARQGNGFGSLLISIAESRARASGCRATRLSIVNHRRDLLGFYERLGYVVCGEAPFIEPGQTRVPCHFIVLSKRLH